MLKKHYILIFILVLSIFIVSAQDTQLGKMEKMRCIQNDNCDYFENEFTCPIDCNLEALQQQREIMAESTRVIESRTSTIERTPKTKSTLTIIFSTFFVILFLILVIGLYSWIHHKATKKQMIKETQKFNKLKIQSESIKETPVRKPIYIKPSYLPKKPRKEW